VATPSRWLKQRVEESLLAPALIEARVIPNAVDLECFHPGDKAAARAAVGLDPAAKVLLFVAYLGRRNPMKDPTTVEAAVARVASGWTAGKLILLVVGGRARTRQIGAVEVRHVPYQSDPRALAQYYRAADVCLHAARAEVWGLVVTEAMACGTPVVATNVGGVPDQVEDGVSGFLVPPRDPASLAARIRTLLEDEALRQKMGAAAAERARQCFGLPRMVDAYVAFYESILARKREEAAREP
jgi:glycosyltransferase involved in cell wall biosynthesis